MKSRTFAFSFWIRICGYGIAINNERPYFSERNGYRKVLRIFGVAFQWLKKDGV